MLSSSPEDGIILLMLSSSPGEGIIAMTVWSLWLTFFHLLQVTATAEEIKAKEMKLKGLMVC